MHAIAIGHTLILDALNLRDSCQLYLDEGLVRVGFTSSLSETCVRQPVTIGFLQTGDRVPLEMLEHSSLHLEAIQPTRLSDCRQPPVAAETICLADWTACLLAIQRLPDSAQRLQALLQLLVHRLGRRHGVWYQLPMRLKHESLAEIVNHSRVTVSRHMSRWRQRGWIDPGGPGSGQLLIAPALIEPSADRLEQQGLRSDVPA